MTNFASPCEGSNPYAARITLQTPVCEFVH
jgi:hypothetical protein